MPDNDKFFYTNSAEVGVSAYDLTIKFFRSATITNESVQPPGPTTSRETPVRIVDTVAVSMSLSHAKALLPSLIHAVRSYESAYGVIAVMPEVQSAYDGLTKK